MNLNRDSLIVVNVILFLLASLTFSHSLISLLVIFTTGYLLYQGSDIKNELYLTMAFWVLVLLTAPVEPKKISENMVDTGSVNCGDKCNVHHIRIFGSNPGFSPNFKNIKKGDIVSWTNVSETVHTVTSNDLKFHSGYLRPGETFDFKFDREGEYDYYCAFQKGWMSGKIIVS